ncbi:permease-like cell division protein FtsX [Rhodocaloribacter litoris]|uniref:cell division protein FtsX n=1 Tax=Rhodocaloribacter litoris TaxID=2558931 RepID=UPI0014216198|nr:permease-like cell division protein FtsX [Rhodocaloribacter litoris]QXD14649.1 permease-like cell division protein FtsX [Rhodocaloribacter litoris]GIV59577.1 MAG: cell division protein FtsX [Rhodothermaceae bacterium]
MPLLPYSVREGLAGLRRARFASVAATSAMAVALVLIGLFMFLSYEAQIVSQWLRQRVGELEIFLEDVDETMAQALHERAAATPGVAEAEYVSRAEAEAIFRREFGEGAEVFFDEPFLPASIKVRVESDYANPDSLAALVEEFASWNRVDDVVFNQPLLVKVQQNLRLLTLIGLSLGTLVVLASIFLVANTIRLTIYARRLLIRTMKLVGATDAFIRKPFIVEGVAQGVLAALLALLVLGGLYSLMKRYLPALEVGGVVPVLLALVVLVLGVLLGWLGSYFSVRRFIKNVALH